MIYHHIVSVVKFKRDKDSAYEYGTIIEAGHTEIIIDQDGNPLLDFVWDFQRMPWLGMIQLKAEY